MRTLLLLGCLLLTGCPDQPNSPQAPSRKEQCLEAKARAMAAKYSRAECVKQSSCYNDTVRLTKYLVQEDQAWAMMAQVCRQEEMYIDD